MTKTPDEIKKGLECLDRMQFFMGQRAGRELWNEKPHDVQERDLEQYNRDVDMVRVLIRQLEKQNRCLKENKESCEKRMIDLAQRMPEWISMEERHPKYGEEVLICKKVGKYKMLAVGYLDEDGCFYTGEGWFAEVTHWMTLPEPPKEE